MLERAILPCLLAGGLLAGLGHVSEMINNQFDTATCAIKSYNGCVQPAEPAQQSASQHRYFSVQPS